MKNNLLRLMYAQKGYTQMEEGKLLSESEDVYTPPDVTSRGFFDRTELALRFLCGLMFVGGAVMLLAAGYVKQSDRDCAAQLSMWCTYNDKLPNSNSIVALGAKLSILSPAPVLDAVEYEERDWVSIFSTHSDFVGTPTVEMEEKWHNLVDSMSSSHLSPSEHSFLTKKSEP